MRQRIMNWVKNITTAILNPLCGRPAMTIYYEEKIADHFDLSWPIKIKRSSDEIIVSSRDREIILRSREKYEEIKHLFPSSHYKENKFIEMYAFDSVSYKEMEMWNNNDLAEMVYKNFVGE